MAKQEYGKTWWGTQWLNAMRYIDFSNRIARGKTYANKGAVQGFELDESNIIQAKVTGSYSNVYSQKISSKQLTAGQKKLFLEALMADPYLLSKLLNRELPEGLIDLAKEYKVKLMPDSWTDLNMHCSCPDWTNPCKHLAAVIYMIVNEIDQNPFLIFQVKGLDILKELESRGFQLVDNAKEKIYQLSDGIQSKEQIKEHDFSATNLLLDFSGLVPKLEEYYQLLPPKQSFYNGNLNKILLQSYKRTTRAYTRAAFDYNQFEKYHQVIKNAKSVSLILNEENQLVNLFSTAPIFPEDKALEYTIGTIATVPRDKLNQYPDTFIALHHVYKFASALLLQKHYLPRLISCHGESGLTYSIQWIPAYNINLAVRQMVEKFKTFCPPDLLLLDTLSGQLEYLDSQEQLFALCQLFLSYYIEQGNFVVDQKKIDDKIAACFFNSQPIDFSDQSEQHVSNSLQLWLRRFYMGRSDFSIILQVEEVYQQQEDHFFIHLLVKNNQDPNQKLEDWHQFVTERKDQKAILGLYKELDVLCEYYSDLKVIINGKEKHTKVYDLQQFSAIFFQIIPILQLLNIHIILPRSLRNLVRPKAGLSISKGSNETGKSFMKLGEMLEFEWEVSLGNEMLSAKEFLEMVDGKTGLVKVKDSYIHLDEDEMQKLIKQLGREPKVSNQDLLHAALSGRYQDGVVSVSEEVQNTLQKFQTTKQIAPPAELKATLRPYQKDGFAWMYKNAKVGLGSLIADDMGLGKTLQVIALLLQFKKENCFKKKQGLVIVPTSLLTNWAREIERFAPTLGAAVYHGSNRTYSTEVDIVITTYGVVRSDLEMLQGINYHCIIIDEAQNIKNTTTAQTKAVKSLKGKLRIAMSGTPVENRLSEYWSILDFTNKGYLGTLNKFSTTYSKPIQTYNDSDKLDTFKRITAPFILRRLKSDKSIIKDLPDKIETNYYANLQPQQAAIYQKVVDTTLEQIRAAEEAPSGSKKNMIRRGLVLKLMGDLKQVANHPYQYSGKGTTDPQQSGKGQLLLNLLDNIQEQQEKVLIFTQYQKMGRLLVEWIEKRYGRTPLYLHGGTPRKKRDEFVDAFQNNKKERIFVLSLKAAGTGLNLTAANHVIHYDLWWNPAVETQATDRAYRIGQQKNVQVYRFISKGTLEEKIDAMIQSKKELADMAVSTGEKWIGDLSDNELTELVQLESD